MESCGALITSHPQLLILTIGCPNNVSPQSEISSCIGCIFLKLSPAWWEFMWWWLDCGAPSSLIQQLLIQNMRCLNVSLQRRFPVAFLKTSSAWWMWWWLGCGGPITSHPTAGSAPITHRFLVRAQPAGERESWEVAPSATCRLGALDTLGNISPGGGVEGGGNTSGNCGEKNAKKKMGQYCRRLVWRRRKKVLAVLLELHQEVHSLGGLPHQMSKGEIWN